jgi:hypothetical protein
MLEVTPELDRKQGQSQFEVFIGAREGDFLSEHYLRAFWGLTLQSIG